KITAIANVPPSIALIPCAAAPVSAAPAVASPNFVVRSRPTCRPPDCETCQLLPLRLPPHPAPPSSRSTASARRSPTAWSRSRALVTEPALLLMDEPFAALDEITRFRLNNDLLTLSQSLRKTVVFVTHSVFESVYLSQRIVVMTPRPGRVFTELVIDAPYPRA